MMAASKLGNYQQNDHFGLAFDIMCKFREMEEKKYIFVCFADNVVDS